jgi:hypothetical protein
MKLVIAALLSLLSVGALANDKLIITHTAPKNSGATVEMEQYGKILSTQGFDIDFSETGQCADGTKLWNDESKKPILLIYSSSWPRTAAITGKPCTADLSGGAMMARRLNPGWLCGLPNAKPLDTPGLKVISPWALDPIVADINRINKWNWKFIQVKQGFKETMMQLQNGEVDYIINSYGGTNIPEKSKSGEIVCKASSKPNDTIPYMGKVFNMKKDFNKAISLYQIAVGKNLSDAQVKTIRSALNPDENAEVKKYLEFQSLGYIPLEKDNKQMVKDYWEHTYQLFEDLSK